MRTLDDEFAEIADSLPGFGGLYLDGTGRLTVVMKEGALDTPMSSIGDALRVVERKRRFGTARPLSIADANVVSGRFSFRDLYDVYRDHLPAVLIRAPGLVLTDIDEFSNRIVVGVDGPSALRETEALLRRATDVPAGMFVVRVVGVPRSNGLLADPLRPVPGGARVYIGSSTGTICTQGFNLLSYLGTFEDPVDATRFFTINAHCSSTQWSLDYSQVFQGGSFFGVEAGDPAGFSGSPCPFNKLCRYSDAALFTFHYDSITSDDGRVAFPTYEGDTSFTAYKTITSTDTPYYGMPVHLIGATSGRQSGYVGSTCVTVYAVTGWGNHVLLCQTSADYESDEGDSGAPVITLYGDGTVSGTGQHWGNIVVGGTVTSYFSAMYQVLNEFYSAFSLNLSPVVY